MRIKKRRKRYAYNQLVIYHSIAIIPYISNKNFNHRYYMHLYMIHIEKNLLLLHCHTQKMEKRYH